MVLFLCVSFSWVFSDKTSFSVILGPQIVPSVNFLSIGIYNALIIPSRKTKTNKQTHMDTSGSNNDNATNVVFTYSMITFFIFFQKYGHFTRFFCFIVVRLLFKKVTSCLQQSCTKKKR
jgi:hypothetical protein